MQGAMKHVLRVGNATRGQNRALSSPSTNIGKYRPMETLDHVELPSELRAVPEHHPSSSDVSAISRAGHTLTTQRIHLAPSLALSGSSIATQDLEWYQFFLMETTSSMAFSKKGLGIWQWYVPNLALSNQFLLHGMLVLAALHKLLSNAHTVDAAERKRCASAIQEHHAIALNLYVTALSRATASTCMPLCCFNIILALFPYAGHALVPFPDLAALRMPTENSIHQMSFHSEKGGLTSPVTNFTHGIPFWRGTHLILAQYRDWIQISPIGNLFRTPDFDQLSQLPVGVTKTLNLIAQSVAGTIDHDKREVYDREMQRLKRAASCSVNPEWHGYVLTYPTHMSQEVAALIQAKDDIALAMLACWAACFHALNHRWWARGWSKDLVVEFVGTLSSEWNDILAWPKATVLESDVS